MINLHTLSKLKKNVNKIFLFKRFKKLNKNILLKEQNLTKILYLLSFVLSIAAWVYYYNNNLTLTYNDARSHLNISRRIVDSLQPGFAQIGSVWLPLQHLLQLPTIWNDYMFRSGLSGSIISMLSFVGSAILIHKVAKLIGLGSFAAATALLAFVLNPNMLFMQSTPMTESLMIFTSLGTIYFFVKWLKEHKLENLILSGAMTFLAVLTRYDGWFIFASVNTLLAFYSYKTFNKARAESNIIIYAVLGVFGVSLWFLWNALIFSDPLYFLNGPFSAKAQQDVLFREGRLLTKFNLPLSSYTYFLVTKEIVGWATMALGTLGIVAAFVVKTSPKIKLAMAAVCVPILFNIVSLFFGHSVIHLPQIPPYTYFNDRYGLMALPAIALGIAFLVNKRALIGVLAVTILVLQSLAMYKNNQLITIIDGTSGSSGYYLDDIGKWLNKNADNGLILVAASSHDSLIFISGLPLNRFITEGTGNYWKESLEMPTRYADFVIMHDGDLVYKSMTNNMDFESQYKLVYDGQYSDVYEKKSFKDLNAQIEISPEKN